MARKNKIWREKNKETLKAKNKIWREENKETIKEKKKLYYQDDLIRKKKREWDRAYGKTNRETLSKKQMEKYHSDPLFKLACRIRGYCYDISESVKKNKKRRSLEYLGCSLEEFKKHIESQWEDGMTWENHGVHGWHIDHILPIDWHIKNSDDPWVANHFSNLQPLWAKKNQKKGNKI